MLINGKNRCPSCMRLLNENEKCECGFDENKYSPSSHYLPIGTILDESIVVGKVIGEGGFGITYIGYDTGLDIRVAVKEYYIRSYSGRSGSASREVIAVSEDKQRSFEEGKLKFIEEARILARFTHEEGLASVYRFFRENNTAYIAMEYIDGITLRRHIESKGVLSEEETINLMLPIMRTLMRLHRRKIIHRDVTPDNIMVETGGCAKLLDLGSARQKTGEEDNFTAIVTHGYAPYEQYSDRGEQGPFTDIYALCACMYKCLTGKEPVRAIDRAKDDSEMSEAIKSLVSVKLSDVLKKGLAVNYHDRYSCIEDISDALSATTEGIVSRQLGLLKDENSFEDVILKDVNSGKDKNRRKIIIIASALITFVILLILGVIIFGHKKTDDNLIADTNESDLISESEEIDSSADKNAGEGEEEKAYQINKDDIGLSQTVILQFKEGEDFPDENAGTACITAIDKRLDTLFGKGEYIVEHTEENESVYKYILDAYQFGDNDSVDLINNYVYSPCKLSLVYDRENYLDISEEDIEAVEHGYGRLDDFDLSRSYGYKEGDYNYFTINVTEEMADKIRDSLVKWSKVDIRNLDSVMYNVFKYGEEIYNSDDEAVTNSQGDGSGKVIDPYICYDFDQITLDNKSLSDINYRRYVYISDDCRNITFVDEENLDEKGQKLLIQVLTGEKYEKCFEYSNTVPALWEEKEHIDRIAELSYGEGQVDADYFFDNDIDAVDVRYKAADNYGDNLEIRYRLQGRMDATGLPYSIGSSVNRDYFYLRLPIDETGPDIYRVLVEPSSDFAIRAYRGNIGEFYSEGSLNYSNITDIIWDKNNVIVNLSPVDLTVLGDSYKEFKEACKKCNNHVIWLTNRDNGYNYLLGDFDEENMRLVFTQSTYEEDGSIPKKFDALIKLYLEGISEKGYRNLSGFKYENVSIALREEDYGKEISRTYGLTNRVQNVVKEKLSDAIMNALGVEPEMYIGGSGAQNCYIELHQSITDKYAENVNRMIEAITDSEVVNSDGIYAINNSIFIELMDGDKQKSRVLIYPKEPKSVTIMAFDYQLSEDEKEILYSEILELENLIKQNKVLKDAEIEVNRVYASSVR